MHLLDIYKNRYLVFNQSIKHRKSHSTFTFVHVPCAPRDDVSTQLTQGASAGSVSDFHPLQQLYIIAVSTPSTLINLTAAFS